MINTILKACSLVLQGFCIFAGGFCGVFVIVGVIKLIGG